MKWRRKEMVKLGDRGLSDAAWLMSGELDSEMTAASAAILMKDLKQRKALSQAPRAPEPERGEKGV